MPILPRHRQHFALYYRIPLDKKPARSASGLPTASAGQWPAVPHVGAGIAETPEDVGMKIFESLYKRSNYADPEDTVYHLLFTSIALMGREYEGKLVGLGPDEAFRIPPTNDVHNMCPRVTLFVGDMPQAYIPLSHLLLRGVFPLHVPCPCRQHFLVSIDSGPDELYDGRIWWLSLEGFQYHEERTDHPSPHKDTLFSS